MAVTDQQLLTEIQYALVEPTVDAGVTWTALWTAEEVLLLANWKQRQFLRETACVISQAVLLTIPNVHRHPLPIDWIVTLAVGWRRPNGTSYALHPATEVDATFAVTSWHTEPVIDPIAYTEVELPTLQIQILPASSDAGLIDLLYQALGATLLGTGIALTVPDDCAWIVKWGMLAPLLDKVGRSADPARAAYAETRYRLGVELVRSILRGGWY